MLLNEYNVFHNQNFSREIVVVLCVVVFYGPGQRILSALRYAYALFYASTMAVRWGMCGWGNLETSVTRHK